MPIAAGSQFGPYEIVSLIGAGGMGEVYRARDTRLDRIVAIKVLPAHLADNPDLRERFEREARTIASLNHPHICVLHDTGRQEGIDFLVMEYLDGETLASRLLKGPLPPEQVLRYAMEIADALDKAHRQGVTHRDLKPGNIMLTKNGSKLLDFGLAKLKQETAPPAVSVSQLPTAGPTAGPGAAREGLTIHGTILGTLQYMAPEQVEGKTEELDGRTDIFSFGAVVHEMATGKKAFQGKSAASLIGAIMNVEPPPISALQTMSPPALDRVVKICLAKDPEDRWQTARDVWRELKWIAEGGSQAGVAAPAAVPRKGRERVAWAVAAMVLVAGLALAAFTYFRPAAPPQTVRFSVGPPEGGAFDTNPQFLTVSPDGSKLAYIAADSPGRMQLWVRALDSEAAQPLSGTENPVQPFWSADSRFLAFYAGGRLKKIAVSGGPAQTLVETGANVAGTWSREGVVLFGSAGAAGTVGTMIRRVSAAGGAATPVTTLDASRQEDGHYWPHFLPDGNNFLYFARSTNPENNAIYAASLDSPARKLLLNAMSNVVYVPPGYLLFNREGTLMAQPFDAGRVELTGEAVPIADDVQFNVNQGRTTFAASQNGVLAYRTATDAAASQLTWFDRTGKQIGTLGEPALQDDLDLSPDGRRASVHIMDRIRRTGDIWIYDLARDLRERLTVDPADEDTAVWSPDGTQIVFRSNRKGPYNLYLKAADGSGSEEPLLEDSFAKQPGSWSPDGRLLLFTRSGGATGSDLFVLPLSGDRKPVPFVQTPFAELTSEFSPDSRWVAYRSDEAGTVEVYVAPFPGPGGKRRVSNGGGLWPRWRADGTEIFYRAPDNTLMVAAVNGRGSRFEVGAVKPLFQMRRAGTGQAYAVTADGQRFLINTAVEEPESAPITVVVNWIEDMKRRVPAE